MTGRKTTTAERISPERFDTREEYLLYLRHAFAYDYAKSLIPSGAHVLEVGSGEGYGTHLLAQSAAKVVGLDVDSATVRHASSKYASSKVEFLLYDGLTIPFDDDHFDVAVSYQVIEHIRDDTRHVAEIHRVLKPGGLLVLTTPNRTYRLKPGQKPWNRFHVREYYPGDLEAVLRKSFPDVQVQGVSGSDSVQAIEKARVAWALRGGPAGALRRALPEPLKALAGTILSKARSVVSHHQQEKDFLIRYSLSDFRAVTDRVEDSLDLLAVCRK